MVSAALGRASYESKIHAVQLQPCRCVTGTPPCYQCAIRLAWHGVVLVAFCVHCLTGGDTCNAFRSLNGLPSHVFKCSARPSLQDAAAASVLPLQMPADTWSGTAKIVCRRLSKYSHVHPSTPAAKPLLTLLCCFRICAACSAFRALSEAAVARLSLAL